MYNNTSRFPRKEPSSAFTPNSELKQCRDLRSFPCSSSNEQALQAASTTPSGTLSQNSVSNKRMLKSTRVGRGDFGGIYKERCSVDCNSSGTEDSTLLDGMSSDSSRRESDDSFHAVHSLSHEELNSGRRKSLPSTNELWRPRNDEKFICSFNLLACFLSSSVSDEASALQFRKRRWFSSPSAAKELSRWDSRDGNFGPEHNSNATSNKQVQADSKALVSSSSNKVSTRPKSADGVSFARAFSVPVSYRNSPYKSCLVLLTTQRLIGVNEVEMSEGGGMHLQWELELDQIDKVTLTGDNTCVNVYKRGLKGKEPYVILLCSKDGNLKNSPNFSQSLLEQSSLYSDISSVSDVGSFENNKRLTPEMLKETIEYECTRARSTKREQRRGRRLDSLKLLAEKISQLQMESFQNGSSGIVSQDSSSSSRMRFFKIFQKKKLHDDSQLSVDDVLIARPRVESEKKPPMPVISLLEECSRYGYD